MREQRLSKDGVKPNLWENVPDVKYVALHMALQVQVHFQIANCRYIIQQMKHLLEANWKAICQPKN